MPANGAGGPALLVDVLGFEQLLDQADLVVHVENGEVRLEASELGVAREGCGRRWSGRCPSTAWPRHEPDETYRCASSSRGRALLVKVTGQDLPTRVPETSVDDVRDAGGEHARLSRTGAGEDQQRALGAQHRVALFLVEATQIVAARGRPN